MALLFLGMLLLIVGGTAAILFLTRMRMLASASQSHSRLPDTDRYRSMLRILDEGDLQFVQENRLLRRRIRAHRRDLFRGYLRCLTNDYAKLLGGIRRIMADSGIDRPDLAKALLRNRVMFALALCRIEFNLRMHALGIGRVDVSGLVEAIDSLRTAINALTPATGLAY